MRRLAVDEKCHAGLFPCDCTVTTCNLRRRISLIRTDITLCIVDRACLVCGLAVNCHNVLVNILCLSSESPPYCLFLLQPYTHVGTAYMQNMGW
jgi:hypothetical protein